MGSTRKHPGGGAAPFFRSLGNEAARGGGNGTTHGLVCGTAVVKVIEYDETPGAANPVGGIPAASGYGYWTISVSNLDDLAAQCAEAGYTVAVEPREIRPGVRIAMIEDPDGNWVELLESS